MQSNWAKPEQARSQETRKSENSGDGILSQKECRGWRYGGSAHISGRVKMTIKGAAGVGGNPTKKRDASAPIGRTGRRSAEDGGQRAVATGTDEGLCERPL